VKNKIKVVRVHKEEAHELEIFIDGDRYLGN
jgi:hypothetical protein